MINRLTTLLLIFIEFSAYSQCDQHIADSAEWLAVEQQIAQVRAKAIEPCNIIRVVVHVVYDSGTPLLNSQISAEQVRSQIRFTNMVLRNDSLAYNEGNAPLGYTLQLATTDPYGNASTGITYTDGAELWGDNWSQYGLKNTNSNAYVSAGIMATALGWGADLQGKKYINCYVVSKIDGHTGGGVQAYAWLPTSSVVYGNYNLYNTFGCIDLREADDPWFPLKSYTNRGMTFTHELGHNLGLFHTFQGNSCEETDCTWQGDRVCDTPPQTQGISCIGACGFLSENVMDYISQSCKNRFTPGQVERMQAVIAVSLQDYLVCATCDKSADFNGDGVVNIFDISLMNAAYGSTEGDANFSSAFDLNCDGVVNLYDFSAVNYNSTITAASSEELAGEQIIYNILGQRVSGRLRAGIYIVVFDGEIAKRLIVHE